MDLPSKLREFQAEQYGAVEYNLLDHAGRRMSAVGMTKRKLMRWIGGALTLFLACNFIFSYHHRRSRRIQYNFSNRSFVQSQRQLAVKKEFLHAWTSYEDHAWMADGLMPLTGQHKTQFCSWSATLVDSLDTLHLMGLTEEFDRAVNATMTIDFKRSAEDCDVNLFESTIRYLGGLLGAFDLSHDVRLLPKLTEIGNILISAFDTSNGMPCTSCKLTATEKTQAFEPANDCALADIASLHLEFTRLSQVLKNDTYVKKMIYLSNVLARTQNDSSLPGLWPESLGPNSIDHEALFARKNFAYSLGAMSDSAYEYLVKGHMLVGGWTDIYSQMWKTAVPQIRKYLLFRALIPESEQNDILFSGIATRYVEQDVMLEPRTQHLACFAGGMFAIASKVFNTPSDLEIGRQLTNGCVWAYKHSPSGIMPESLTLVPCKEMDGTQCLWNSSQWYTYTGRQENCTESEGDSCLQGDMPAGFYSVLDEGYYLRPEAIESVFIMWRMTGEEHWRDVGWEMFQNIIKYTRTAYGHAALSSVMHLKAALIYERGVRALTEKPEQKDDMESFWFAETLKYFYLLFSDVDLLDLDEFVLNTEAHPLRLEWGSRGF